MTNETKARFWIVIVMIGLVISGVTAFPLLYELNLLAEFFATDQGGLDPSKYNGLAHWIMKVREGLDVTYATYPFVAYGTDWLAFGHLVIALFFILPFREPTRYAGVLTIGIWASLAVIPFALVCGPIRQIPFYWRLIDCSFGILCIPPLFIARRFAVRSKTGET